MAPDSGVQVAGLFLETATRPFPLASFVSWPALKDKDKQQGLLKAQIITTYKKRPITLWELQENNVQTASG